MLQEEFIEEQVIGDDDDEDESTPNESAKRKHENLIDSIVHIGKKRKVTIRNEAITVPNEFVVSTNTTGKKIKGYQLLKSLNENKNINELKRQLSKITKHQAVLKEPVPKIQAEKAERVAAYEQESKSMKKWDPIVEKYRTAETVSFPLQQPNLNFQTTQEFVEKMKPLTSLERDIAAILHKSENNIQENSLLTKAEKKIISKMDILQAKEKLLEMKKMRALVSYQQSKFKRTKKIKSKKYRRLVRKDRQKQEEKELEKLSKENPDEFAEKMEQLEKLRIQERHTLRHKNTSKWAKEKAIYAQFNTKAREEMEEQLKLGKKLRAKPALSDDEDGLPQQTVKKQNNNKSQTRQTEIPLIIIPPKQDENNPWLSGTNGHNKPRSPTSEYSKLTEIKNDETSSDEEEEEVEEEKEEGDKDSTEVVVAKRDKEHKEQRKRKDEKRKEEEKMIGDEKKINKNGYGINSVLNMELPKLTKQEDNQEVPNTTDGLKRTAFQLRQMNIQEAFADDDVIAAFEKEKNEIEERDRPKPIDLMLPGWGDWGGAGIAVNTRKKRKFLIKPPPAQPRKDVHLNHVIINEKKDKKLAQHLVSELPYPYVNIDQFESTIKQPLGKEWNPEIAFRRLNQPKVTTKLGTIIEPMDKSELFDKKKKMNIENEQTSTIEDTLFDNNEDNDKKKKKHNKKGKRTKKNVEKS